MAETDEKVVPIKAVVDRLTVEQARERLAPFLEANPVSSIIDGDKWPAVKSPWGDDSLTIDIAEDCDDLISALNSVYLPERLTAIWHKSHQSIEVIYTAFPLREQEDLYSRSFQFRHRERDYACEFGDTSAQLAVLAKNYRSVSAPTTTFFRNLDSYKLAYTFPRISAAKTSITFKPTSFWIRGISSWNEETVLDLIGHLNFYMRYYDAFSPVVVTHLIPSENINHQPIERFGYGPFPKLIESKHIDESLLHFCPPVLWGPTRLGALSTATKSWNTARSILSRIKSKNPCAKPWPPLMLRLT